ncbi:sulfate/molybdate ABC transporter ATP-binding protein [Chelatococcus sp. SYSU_G07232]|uniref:Sulfate/molybdate ABC transporter ATP-binding protein n=1 Tax=Chelatococcus albus TaxID=3047466 RepID=A0ABT7AJT9_9HYPH|nr:sulfate/molybdate ABC transporter ATP-binding protein [Chelatococcus sp. SYSU_G07232]MDJ1159632.1 sulfate/molybdate ABC transporter ATP-binding protein [Chelatococcus sp. SYSU_G07232]
MAIAIKGIEKRFADAPVLRGIDLTIADGELVALLGASGSGKTTLLRILAGLEWPQAGSVTVDGRDWLALEAQRRRVGFVFQHYALFQHMSVRDNVAFGLTVRPRASRPPKGEIRARVEALLDLVEIGHLANRFPAQLSGGQRQRVALARALAIEPKVLLLDEPFGALDARIRKDLRRWLRELHDRLGMTTIFVTHDQDEAFELADRVVIMSDGRIEQAGTPDEIYDHPASPFVARFLGGVNELPAELAAGRLVVPGADAGAVTPPAGTDGTATLFVRPHEIDLVADSRAPARIRNMLTSGPSIRYDVDLPGLATPVEVELPREAARLRNLRRGDAVRLRLLRGRVFSAHGAPLPPAAPSPERHRILEAAL